jgi:hypothetical protein
MGVFHFNNAKVLIGKRRPAFDYMDSNGVTRTVYVGWHEVPADQRGNWSYVGMDTLLNEDGTPFSKSQVNYDYGRISRFYGDGKFGDTFDGDRIAAVDAYSNFMDYLKEVRELSREGRPTAQASAQGSQGKSSTSSQGSSVMRSGLITIETHDEAIVSAVQRATSSGEHFTRIALFGEERTYALRTWEMGHDRVTGKPWVKVSLIEVKPANIEPLKWAMDISGEPITPGPLPYALSERDFERRTAFYDLAKPGNVHVNFPGGSADDVRAEITRRHLEVIASGKFFATSTPAEDYLLASFPVQSATSDHLLSEALALAPPEKEPEVKPFDHAAELAQSQGVDFGDILNPKPRDSKLVFSVAEIEPTAKLPLANSLHLNNVGHAALTEHFQEAVFELLSAETKPVMTVELVRQMSYAEHSAAINKPGTPADECIAGMRALDMMMRGGYGYTEAAVKALADWYNRNRGPKT